MRTSLLTASLWLCACGPVAAPPLLDRSMEASRSALLEAAVSVDRAEDRVLRAELQVWDHILATRALGPSARGRQETLIDHVLHALEHNQPLTPARQSETPLLALLTTPALRLRGALQRGWLGLVPLLHAPLPGRFLFIVEDTLLAADLGSVSAPVRLPGHAREILEVLSEGPRSKEDLVREVWRVARYAAQLHDPVVYTAITRLRRALGPASEWLQTTAQGYALHPEVKTLTLALDAPQRESLEDAPDRPILPITSVPAASDPLVARIQSLLARPLSSAQLAEALGVSEATTLRRLRILASEGVVVREGIGKRTRYRWA